LAIFLVAAVGVGIRYAFVTSADQAAINAAPRITDTAFEASATAVCKRFVQVFNTETTLGNLPTNAQSAGFLDSIATSFDSMVAQLRALPVGSSSFSLVQGWFNEWDTYDAYGHRYAAAVKAGSERDLVANDKSNIDGLLRQRNAFAKANHMGACAFS
jgi:hypothetical protein